MGVISFPATSRDVVEVQALTCTVERRPAHVQACEPIWRALLEGWISVTTSKLSRIECFVLRLRENDAAAADRFARFVAHPASSLLELLRDVLRSAARLRAIASGFTAPDAIHLASAAVASCDHIVTNDRARLGTTGAAIILRDDQIATES